MSSALAGQALLIRKDKVSFRMQNTTDAGVLTARLWHLLEPTRPSQWVLLLPHATPAQSPFRAVLKCEHVTGPRPDTQHNHTILIYLARFGKSCRSKAASGAVALEAQPYRIAILGVS
jgi:hypothetical protein